MPGSGLPLVTMNCETNPAGQEKRLRKSFVGITDKQKARITRFRAFSCLNVGDPPRGRTENLLIKSHQSIVEIRPPNLPHLTIYAYFVPSCPSTLIAWCGVGVHLAFIWAMPAPTLIHFGRNNDMSDKTTLTNPSMALPLPGPTAPSPTPHDPK